jgi:RecJ-like exonuclease
MTYDPIDNDSDCDEFDITKIEQMEIELSPCPHCEGGGIVFNGVIYWRCPKCAGTGEIVKGGIRWLF